MKSARVTLALILGCFIISSGHAQKSQPSDGFGDIILQVDKWEGDASATQFLAVSRNRTLVSPDWDETLASKVRDGNPYALYYKGNRVGEFILDTLRVDEDYVWMEGRNSFIPGMASRLEADSLRYWLTAISASGSLSLPCFQPVGLTREKLLLDANCDGRLDTIAGHVLASSAKVVLMLGTGTTELVDSFSAGHPLEKLFIDDVFDIDSDAVPEILTTHYRYPTHGYVVYKKTGGTWHRWLESFGFGD